MLFAGLLLDGAIVGYDSNIPTGGVGAVTLALEQLKNIQPIGYP